jgi:hypothetical protein
VIREELARLFTFEERHRRLLARLLLCVRAVNRDVRRWDRAHMDI